MRMKVITFNIWDLPFWFIKDRKKRIAGIVQYLKNSDADVICLQESFDIYHRAFLCDALKDRYHIAGNTKDHRRILFFKLFDVTGGLIILSKFPILYSRFVPYNRFLNSAITEALGRKGFLEVICKTPRGNLKVVNTHMHQETLFFSRKIRLRQTANMLRRTNHDQLPTIIAGDFNENYMIREHEFAELFKLTGFLVPSVCGRKSDSEPTYRPDNRYVDNWLNRIRFPKRYDYVFVKNTDAVGLQVVRYEPEYLKPPLSDHDPVILELADDHPCD